MKSSEGSEKVMQMSTFFYFSLIIGKKALYSGHKVGVTFIDFRKAFDCVDHSILCVKRTAAGISGDLWVKDDLSHRMQMIRINKSCSDLGSLLGPRLFVTYVNDLPKPNSVTKGEVFM